MSETSRRSAPPVLVLVLVLVLGCDRSTSTSTSTSTPTPTPSAEPARPNLYARAAIATGEAPVHVVRDRETDPVLRPFLGRVRERFKDPRAPLVVQRASLFGGGAATLVTELGPSDSMPLLWVEDRERKLLWDKERPTAAMLPPVRDPVIVGRSKGGVALFAYDVPARVVAGRLLDADGTPFTDINIIRADDCQRMSAAHFPKRGIVVVCSRPRGALLQLLREITRSVTTRKASPPAARSIPAPMSVAFDSETTMMLVQYATKDRADRVQVHRLDAAGRPLWAEPRDIGEVARVVLPAARLSVTDLPGGVRVMIPSAPPRVVEIDSDGTVRPAKG